MQYIWTLCSTDQLSTLDQQCPYHSSRFSYQGECHYGLFPCHKGRQGERELYPRIQRYNQRYKEREKRREDGWETLDCIWDTWIKGACMCDGGG